VSAVAVILILLLLAVVILVIAAPLRGGDADTPGPSPSDPQGATAIDTQGARQAGLAREQLEAAREAKYREIRDSELDYRTGKLSQEDYAAIDAQLRAEAIDILNGLEQLERPSAEDPTRRVDAPDA
jgi:hypothetical protein